MRLAITLFATAIPTLLYLRIVHAMDRYEREPLRYVVLTFLWGAVPAVIAGGVIELISDAIVNSALGAGLLTELVSTGVTAPIIEESLKAIAVAGVYWVRRREFDGWVDGLIYGSSVGFGFGFVENILYLQTTGAQSSAQWISLFILRVLLFGMLHAFWTGLTGIGFGVARHSRTAVMRFFAPLLGLCAAITGHMFHNSTLVFAKASGGATLCFTLLNYGLAVGGFLAMSIISANKERELLKTMLIDEVPAILSLHNYATLHGPWPGMQERLQVNPRQRRTFVQSAAELAQKKFQAGLQHELSAERGSLSIVDERLIFEIEHYRQQLQKIGDLPT